MTAPGRRAITLVNDLRDTLGDDNYLALVEAIHDDRDYWKHSPSVTRGTPTAFSTFAETFGPPAGLGDFPLNPSASHGTRTWARQRNTVSLESAMNTLSPEDTMVGTFSHGELEEACAARGLSDVGSKHALAARLVAYFRRRRNRYADDRFVRPLHRSESDPYM